VELRPSATGAWITPPAALSEGVAVLYILLLRGKQFYVGQTDTLRGRLAQHRRTHGGKLQGMLVTEVVSNGGGTAAARHAETILQRRLLREGFSLISGHDATHQNFGLTPTTSMATSSTSSPTSMLDAKLEAGDVQQLREMAADLLALAKRWEERL